MEGFKAKYHIPLLSPDRVLIDREVGEAVIPMIAFIERGMTFPMSRITRDYLFNHKLCPYHCASNLFRVLGIVDALNN